MSNNEPEWTEGRIVSLLGHAVVPMSPIVLLMMVFLTVPDHVVSSAEGTGTVIVQGHDILKPPCFFGLLFVICGLVVGVWALKEKCPVAVAEGFATAGVILLMFFINAARVGP